ADREAQHLDPAPAGHQVVPEFMDEDQDRQGDEERDQGLQEAHWHAPSTNAWAWARARRSMSRTESRQAPAASPPSRSSTCSLSRQMSRKPIRPARKDSTATSLAALR